MKYDPIGNDEQGFVVNPQLVTRVAVEKKISEREALWDLAQLGYDELIKLAAEYREIDK